MRLARLLLAAALVMRGAPDALGQARDTLTLRALQTAAERADPRLRQLDLQRTMSGLRQRNLAAERLPSVGVDGMAQYQSDVPKLPGLAPGAFTLDVPHDTYDARLGVQERLFDPTLGPRQAVEHASLAEAEARVRTNLYALRAEVSDAFFSAALMQARAGELAAVTADLEAQLRVAQARVREGTALASESGLLQAELLRRRQDREDLDATRRASLVVLASLARRAVAPNDTLVLPDLAALVEATRDSLVHKRPELEQFARTRDRLAEQERAVAAQTLPRVTAYARAGYGKPGLNFLQNSFDSYWLGGVQVQWTPWSWGATGRERESLALERDVVASDEAAFMAAMQRAVARQLADVDRLVAALRTDDAIIVLRERIERETRRRYEEGVITAAEYVDRRNDVFGARMARSGHEVELAQARARYLTTIGQELP